MTESIEQVAARRLEAEEEQRREVRLRELVEEIRAQDEAERREREAAEARGAAIVTCRELAEARAEKLAEIDILTRKLIQEGSDVLELEREERGIRSRFGLPGQYAPLLSGILPERLTTKISRAFGGVALDPRQDTPLPACDPLPPESETGGTP